MPASPLDPLRAAATAAVSVIAGISPAQWSAPTPCPALDDLYEAFAAPGALDRIVTVPFGQVPGAVALHLRVVELVVHGWDLARATGQRVDVPDDVVRAELEFTRQTLPRVPADRMPIGPPQPAGEAASALDELAALLGPTG